MSEEMDGQSKGKLVDCKNWWPQRWVTSKALLAVLGLVFMLSISAQVVSAETVAGFARVNITPPVGFRVAGNYFESISKGVNDPHPATAVISLAQDLDFYLPTRKAFAEGS